MVWVDSHDLSYCCACFCSSFPLVKKSVVLLCRFDVMAKQVCGVLSKTRSGYFVNSGSDVLSDDCRCHWFCALLLGVLCMFAGTS